MITLSPYHPDFNPNELVFGTLLRRLPCNRVSYKSIDTKDFKNAIKIGMGNFNLKDMISFLKDYRYYL